ncbi:hypothetical protein BJX61DRAFT_545349 [Aspergillus egyptiacus]|nr:hypothetical protein BJX61DRAFT_545349 [Aspergillus egyptiacus]
MKGCANYCRHKKYCEVGHVYTPSPRHHSPCYGLGLLTKLTDSDDTKPVALADLMKVSGVDKSLLSAIMGYQRHHGSAVEPRQGFCAPAKLTYNLLDPEVVTTLTFWHDIIRPTYGSLHRALTSDPDNLDGSGKKTAFQVTRNTTQSFYDWLESHPEQHASFYGYMAAVHSVMTKWTDVVHFDEELTQNMQEDEVVFVDMGGGDGLQCIEVQKVHKPGSRIIMQDCAAIIEKAEIAREAGVETMVYDFFTEQTVKAARAYFIQFLFSTGLIIAAWHAKGELPRRTCRFDAGYPELLERAGLELEQVRMFTKFGQAVIMAKRAGL